MKTLDFLNWRYATKAMNGKKVESDKLHNILEAIRLSPTSSGLQPYEVLLVSSQELKDKIKAVSFNQQQVSECSDILIFAAWDTYTADRINSMFDLVNEEREFSNEGWENYRQMLLKNYVNRDAETNFTHAAKQAYIGLGVAMVAAAELQVDSVPMEGFDPKALDELLNLKALGLRSVVLLPVGYRDVSRDWLVNLKKVRRSFDNFVRKIG